MHILLIAGLWLDGSAWDDVVPALETLGHPAPCRFPARARSMGQTPLTSTGRPGATSRLLRSPSRKG